MACSGTSLPCQRLCPLALKTGEDDTAVHGSRIYLEGHGGSGSRLTIRINEDNWGYYYMVYRGQSPTY